MKKLSTIIAAGLLIVLAVWLYQKLFPGDERRIRNLLMKVAETATLKPNEHQLFRLTAAGKLAGFFTEDAEVHLDVQGLEERTIQGRAELQRIIAAARASLQSVDVQIPDAQVEVGPSRQSASAHIVVVAAVNGEKNAVVQELKLQFSRTDGKWLIARVDAVHTLQTQ